MQTVSERIRWLRESAGINKRTLSRLARLTDRHVARIEMRGGERIEARTAIAIADVFAVSVEWILLGKGRRPSVPAITRAAFIRLERLRRRAA